MNVEKRIVKKEWLKFKKTLNDISYIFNIVKKSRYKKIFIVTFGVYLATLIIAIYIAFQLLPNIKNSWLNRDEMLYILLFCKLLTIAAFLIFIRKTLIPLINVDRVMQYFENNKYGIHIDIKEDIVVYSKKLNTLLIKLNDIIDQENKSQIEKKQAEFNALQSRIDPHFLYNTLDSIRGQALRENSEEIADMIEALSNMFRYTISQKQNMFTFEQELKNSDNYFKIQQYRFDNKFEFIKILDHSDASIMSYQIPKLTLQPIIENAIYHGLETKEGKGTITLRAYTTQSRFIISIEDDGIGLDKYKIKALNERFLFDHNDVSQIELSKTTGIALENINERIQFYFGKKFGLTIMSTLGVGTVITLVLPKMEETHEK